MPPIRRSIRRCKLVIEVQIWRWSFSIFARGWWRNEDSSHYSFTIGNTESLERYLFSHEYFRTCWKITPLNIVWSRKKWYFWPTHISAEYGKRLHVEWCLGVWLAWHDFKKVTFTGALTEVYSLVTCHLYGIM